MHTLTSVSITDVLRRISQQTHKLFVEPTDSKRNIPCIAATHEDSTASLHVAANDRVFFCHGLCNGGGGIIDAPVFFGLAADKKESLAWLVSEGFLEPSAGACPKCGTRNSTGLDSGLRKCRNCSHTWKPSPRQQLQARRPQVKTPLGELWWVDPANLLPEAAQFRAETHGELLATIGKNRFAAVRRKIAEIRTALFAPHADDRLVLRYTAIADAGQRLEDADPHAVVALARERYPQLFMFNVDA